MINTIELNIKSLEFVSGKNTTGGIFFSFDGQFFPEYNWNDFVEIILNWWCEGLLSIYNLGENQCKLTFMDGPVNITVFNESDRLRLECYNGLTSSKTLYYVDKNKFLNEIIRAINFVIRSALESGIKTTETICLEKNITLLLNANRKINS